MRESPGLSGTLSGRALSAAPLQASAQAAPSPSLGRTLEALDNARRYRDWIFSTAAPHLAGPILEVGAGSGTLTECVAGREFVVALEIEPVYAAHLRRRFAARNVEIVEGSATDHGLLQSVAKGRINSAMSFNVLEHIPDDSAALRCIHDVLPRGGRFVAFVPAFPSIYGAMDRALGHVRRYTKRDLTLKMRKAGFRVVEARYVNLPGFFVWFANGRILRSPGIPGGNRAVTLYDRLAVPVTRAIENRWKPPFGQSLLVVGEVRSLVESGG